MFESELNKNIATTNMTTRGSSKYNLRPVFKNKQFNESFLPQAIKIWNIAPATFKETKSISAAKKIVKGFAATFPL